MENANQIDEVVLENEALELMEGALAILVALENSRAACTLQACIDQVMQSWVDPEAEGEYWDDLSDLPHLTERALHLHRQNGLTVDQIAQRLHIDGKEAAERLSIGLRCVREPARR